MFLQQQLEDLKIEMDLIDEGMHDMYNWFDLYSDEERGQLYEQWEDAKERHTLLMNVLFLSGS